MIPGELAGRPDWALCILLSCQTFKALADGCDQEGSGGSTNRTQRARVGCFRKKSAELLCSGTFGSIETFLQSSASR